METCLHLASASPRRADILRGLGLSFTQGGTNVDETPLDGEAADDMVLRLARNKADASDRDAVILAADTAVVLDGVSFGKPDNRADAERMLRALSGRAHEVMTGVAVRGPHGIDTRLSVSVVTFRRLGDEDIERYWLSREPVGKAGAYAIQGLGGLFVESLSGSYTGVVGLPVFETAELLANAGIDILQQVKA